MTGEVIYEKYMVEKLELKYGPNYYNLEAYKWLEKKFSFKLKMKVRHVCCFANVVSEYCKIPIHRENYRRLPMLLYWIQENLDEIKAKLSGKTLCFLHADGEIQTIDF